ncbi:hypothetical protein FAQ87_06605, partial [Klebsiella pneumoniae]
SGTHAFPSSACQIQSMLGVKGCPGGGLGWGGGGGAGAMRWQPGPSPATPHRRRWPRCSGSAGKAR